MLFSNKKKLLKLGGICGITTAVLLPRGFVLGEQIASAFAGTTLPNGEPAGTMQTYGESLEDLLVRLDEASTFHIVARALLFIASLLSIPMLFALHVVIRDHKTRFTGLSLAGLVLGVVAAITFATSHVVTGTLSLDIANKYAQAPTEEEKRAIVTMAQALDASIGLTSLDNSFKTIVFVFIALLFLPFGLALPKTHVFDSWLGWSSIFFWRNFYSCVHSWKPN